MRKMIPSMLTLVNLLSGFAAILFIYKGEIEIAMLLIMTGLVCDFFDGFCARRLHAVSALGKELDSLADLVTFTIAPATLVYVLSLHEIYVFGAFCCLAYVCCGALRLARFNVTQSHISGFIGMPTPLAAVLVLVVTHSLKTPMAAIGVLVIGLLMISRLSFPSLKTTKSDVTEDC